MSKRLAIITATLLLTLLAGYGVYAYSKPKTPQTAPKTVTQQVKPVVKPPTRAELLKLVNIERKRAGVAPLVEDKRLDQSAQRKADEMVAENRYEHTNKAGVHGYMYIREVAPECVTVSENFYTSNYDITAKNALDWWKNSPPHIKAIKNEKYDSTGFGITYIHGDMVAVQHFCDYR